MTIPDPSAASDHNHERLQRLAAFASNFRNPATSFGIWRGMTGVGSLLEPVTMPWFENSEIGKRFAEMLYRYGWILTGFDWVEWRESAEGKALDYREAIASANEEQLARLLTALIRSDRFEQGALAKAFEDKVLLAIVERAETLGAESLPKPPQG